MPGSPSQSPPRLHRRCCRPADFWEYLHMLMRVGLGSLPCLVFLLAGPVSLFAAETKPLPKAAPPTTALKSLRVYPSEITLGGPRDSQRVVVLGEYADGRNWDLSRDARLTSSVPAVARV